MKDTNNLQPHYNNSEGSLYLLAEKIGLNHWEFDVFKRLVRCRKKGEFERDLNKIKDTIDLYLSEYTPTVKEVTHDKPREHIQNLIHYVSESQAETFEEIRRKEMQIVNTTDLYEPLKKIHK